MLLTAQVIVDVPTMQTDQPFTYVVPADLHHLVAAGMRVVVPFGKGGRLVQGFVMSTHEVTQSELDNSSFDWKEIVEVMDLAPVLNQELLALADEMRKTTFSFKITCLQTMLPSVMRSRYQKKIVVIDELPPELEEPIFKGLSEIDWSEAEQEGYLPTLMKLKQQGKVEVHYQVEKKNKTKMQTVFTAALDFEQLEEARVGLSKRAKQKSRLLSFLQTLGDKTYSVKKAKEEYGFSRALLNEAQAQGWLIYQQVEVYRDPFANRSFTPSEALQLTPDQQTVLEPIQKALEEKQNQIFLLEGVTGSGKTEVYLQAIAQALAKGQGAILLVPEISLTPQTVERFKSRFGDEVAVLHSGLSHGEKYDEWRKIERGEAHVVVGARSAIFAPLEQVGIIIIDEEHEGSYKQEETPRYHARNLAIWRGGYHHCPVVLGSATPSLESRARAQKGVYQLLQLTQRAYEHAVLPDIELVDMRQEFKKENTGNFSQLLMEKITDRLAKQEQIVLLLNRRGYSSFFLCRDCGYVLPCPNCDISLTLHMDTKKMKCHYCGHEEAIPHHCPQCGSNKIRYYGTGTQKVEEELKNLFPTARILRMDVDTTRRKGAHEKLLATFGHHDADILLGTQMIAKGLDFPNVTLVGVLNADTALNLPDFRSSERTFQLLTQVSGRAGRADKQGEVVIQSFNPGHYAIQLAKQQNYEQFYRQEMILRRQGQYPPYYFTVLLTASHPEEIQAAKKMFQIGKRLKSLLSPESILLGPTPKAILRINNRYYYQIVIKYKQESALSEILKEIQQEAQVEYAHDLKLSIDIEPMYFI